MQIGKKNTLKVLRKVDFGFYLDAEEYDSVLLPMRYAPENLLEGDEIEVFIYLDSEDRIIATTEVPFAKVGEFAYLLVRQVNKFGAYLDWGLPKDLFVPYREQKLRMVEGKKYWVYVYVDNDTDRIAATAKIERYLDKYNPPYSEGDEVMVKIHSKTELGTKVIVDNLYWGIVYKNESFGDLQIGTERLAYIKKVREDLKLDVSFSKSGYQNKISDVENVILSALSDNNGFLPLHDKSSAEEIQEKLSMSKKSFKMAVGGLYKAGKIVIESNGIRLQ